jgi:hypothetical protein
MTEASLIDPESIHFLGQLVFLGIGVLIGLAFRGNGPRGT